MITTLGLAFVATLPDAIDHLKSADIIPNVSLLLDASCSMGYNPRIATTCTWWANTYNGGNLSFTKNDVMRSVLTGCASPEDGILDKWANRVNFSIYQFGHVNHSAALVTPFGSSKASLETGAQSIRALANTPMSYAIGANAQYFNTFFRDSNTLACRPNFVLLLSDGDPNGNSVWYEFNCPKPGDPLTRKRVLATEPWEGSEYLTEHRDMLCSVAGDQDIRTYSIGFGAPGSFSPSNLQSIATVGRGEYYYAADVQQLDHAFTQIITSMAARAALFYAQPAVQLDGLFSDNVVYTSAFRANSQGPWNGTVKKHCIEPRRLANGRYDSTDQRCVFRSEVDGKTLMTNPSAMDLWTGTTTTAATVGGAGAVLTAQLGPLGGVPRQPFYPRNIVSWRPGQQGYVPVTPASWSMADSWTRPAEHPKLLNKLHGYTYNSQQNGDPVSVAEWPLGDPVHTTTVLLKYGDSCEVPGNCFTVVGMNDGMLHFFDSANGRETSALIPAELWSPNQTANNLMRDIVNQPDLQVVHRYYVDGAITLFHDDLNGDGRIQDTERAYLIFGLGRGGAAYYSIPISRFNGVLSASNNPVLPLPNTPGTVLDQLQDTWAAPWSGLMRFDGAVKGAAVFASGHIRAFDDPGYATPSRAPKPNPMEPNERNRGCPAVAGDNGFNPAVCSIWNGGGYPDPAPQDRSIGPFSIANAVAYRLRFVGFDVHPSDRLEIRDGAGNVIQTLTGAGPPGGLTEWIYDRRIELRWLTNGVPTSNRGWHIGQFDYREQPAPLMVDHYPTIFAVDIDKWNGSGKRPFAATSEDGGVLLRITRQCQSPNVGTCIDRNNAADLAEMTCPISTEVSAYTVGGLLSALYWGDECGQIWKAWATDGGYGRAWTARRLFSANTPQGNLQSQSVSRGSSKDFRKIFRKLDLVATTCPGRPAVGVYFGTGNVQRPVATDALTNVQLNDGREIVGLLWDTGDLPAGLNLSHLANATDVDRVDSRLLSAQGRRGWYLRLDQNERMLRDPLVFEGVAHFKTFRPTQAAAECSRSSGVDSVIAVSSCSAEAVSDVNRDGLRTRADRRAWTGNQDIGGNLLVVTPKNGPPIVSHANLASSDRAVFTDRRRSKAPKIFNWREPGRLP